jgi:DNA polymerase III alpha subunit
MLDNYEKNMSDLDYVSISELEGKDDRGKLLYSERDRVKLCGIITSVSVKTTRNQEQMAFFQLEDKYASCECIVFSKKYAELYPEIFVDNAVHIEGTVSIKDDDSPKILVNSIVSLTENEKYEKRREQKQAPAPQSVLSTTMATSDTQPAMNDALNMYLSIYQASNAPSVEQKVSASTTSKPQVTPQPKTAPAATKIYIKVPDMSSDVMRKVRNIVDIFNEGSMRVIFYDSSTKKYSEYSEKLNYSAYVHMQLSLIVGEDNVVTK